MIQGRLRAAPLSQIPKSLGLGARLFLSCFVVSALLFAGIYFYVKGFNEARGLRQANEAFDRSVGHLHGILRTRSSSVRDLAIELSARNAVSLARVELEAAGLTFVVQREGRPESAGLPLTPDDSQRLSGGFAASPSLVSLSSGRYLVRAAPGLADLLLLYPLYELDRANRELLEAFLVAGLALLVLTMAVAQLLAREISRPLTSLRDRMRAMAENMGLEPPRERGDEMREIAESYAEFAHHVQTAFQHKQLALEELEAYKGELLRVNTNLQRRLFQVKVLLSLWSERDKALDVKDFLSRFLEALLPGLPFEYGCVIIRPLADMGSETIFARKVADGAAPRDDLGDAPDHGGALWTDIVDPEVEAFLLRESAASMETHAVRMSSVQGRMRAGTPPGPITVLSLRLQQGNEPLGSVHFLTERANPQVSAGVNEFLLNLSAQVSAQLQIQALSFATRLDPLTRLYNRGYLNDRLREEIVRCSRKREPFSLVLLDIDHLPELTAEHGQPAADEVLRGVAALLKSSCRGSDAVCRFAGPVLAIVLADTASAGARVFAENVRKAVEAGSFPVPGGSVKITASLGMAEFPGDGDGLESLVAQAEHALRSAKEAGRNTGKSAA